MGFFDRFRPDEPDDDWDDEDAGDLSAAYIGGSLALDVVVARSAGAVVAVRKVVVYPEYFEFTIEAWARQPVRNRSPRSRWDFSLLEMLDSRYGTSSKDPDYLRLGLQFPDGGVVSNIDTAWWRLSPDSSPPDHGMMPQHGSGSMRHADQAWRAWPVPDGGVLTVVCEWPVYGIAETRYEIDANLLSEAARRVQAVWPDLPGDAGSTPPR